LLEFFTDLLRFRIELAIRERHISHGDRERRHELSETEKQTDGDVAPHPLTHEFRRIRPEQDVDEIPDQKESRQREDERSLGSLQRLESRGFLDGDVVDSSGRFVGDSVSHGASLPHVGSSRDGGRASGRVDATKRGNKAVTPESRYYPMSPSIASASEADLVSHAVRALARPTPSPVAFGRLF